MALFIINFRQFVCLALSSLNEVGGDLLVTKVSWAEVVSDVLCDVSSVSSHIQTCSRAVQAKISLLIHTSPGRKGHF